MQAVYLSSYLSMFSTIFLPTTSQSLVPLQSKKRGMVMNYIAGDVAKANCGWYYNYGVKPTVMNRNRVRTNSSVGFVPMVQNRLSSYALTTPPEAILGFNEPDLFSGSSITSASQYYNIVPLHKIYIVINSYATITSVSMHMLQSY